MRRIVLFISVAAVMAAIMAASALPAMADVKFKDNDRHDFDVVRVLDDDRHDFVGVFDNDRHDFDRHDFLVFDPFFVGNDFVADDLCSPLNPDAVNNLVSGCIF